MTLAFSGLDDLIQEQFSVNEIASSLLVGKIVGSVFIRKTDASIFEPLGRQYGLHVGALPPWLRNISLERSGTVLGENLRRIHARNTIIDTSLGTVEGLATFLVLILRYVEPPQNIVDYLEQLLKGGLYINSSESLEARGPDTSGGTVSPSTRKILRSFVNSVLDADASSPQKARSLDFMGYLVKTIGIRNFLNASARHSQESCIHLLSRILGGYGKAEDVLHTCSAGSAMIALAALANGADIRIECITDHGRILVPPEGSQSTDQASFVVCLWLTQTLNPPKDMVNEPGMKTEVPFPDSLSGSNYITTTLPIYGGIAEISAFVAQQFGCSNESDCALALWARGMEVGEAASWVVKYPRKFITPPFVSLYLTNVFLESQVTAQLAPLANTYYPHQPSNRRHLLARKAACVFHEVYQYKDYRQIDEAHFRSSMNLILVSIAVGCMKSLIQGSWDKLTLFSWTLDCQQKHEDNSGIQGFCERIAYGVSLSEVMWMVASIWGGFSSSNEDQVGADEGILGIACPQFTVLLNVLSDPKLVAEFGFSKGLMSIHEGSLPMLPRDPINGYVLAGNPKSSLPRRFLDHRPSRKFAEIEPGDLLFTIEPYIQEGSLRAVLAGWMRGDIVLQIDPSIVLDHLLMPSRWLLRGIIKPHISWTCKIINVSRSDLLTTGVTTGYFIVGSGVGVFCTGGKAEWQVAAAGCIQTGKAIMVRAGDFNADDIRFDPSSVPPGYAFVLCTDNLPPLLSAHSSRQVQLNPGGPPVSQPELS